MLINVGAFIIAIAILILLGIICFGIRGKLDEDSKIEIITLLVIMIFFPILLFGGYCLTGNESKTSKYMINFDKIIVLKHDNSIDQKIERLEKIYDKLIELGSNN